MAYSAVVEFMKLSKRKYDRRTYTLQQAEEMVQKLIGDGTVEIKNLLELKQNCLSNPLARRELTKAIYDILVEHGIDIEGAKSIRHAAELLYAEMYGYSIFQPYMDDPAYNEVFCNDYDDCWGIQGLERIPLSISFRDEEHALKLLERLTMDSRQGKAAHDNRLNSTVLADRTRLRWALPPVAEGISMNLRKHTVQDMRSITPERFVKDQIMTRPVFALLVGMAVMGVCYGILGPGGVGKTALLRVILKEVHERIRPRFLVSENGAELNLKEYLKIVGCEKVDVNSLQKWSGKGEGLADIFANFMQAKGEFIIQPEVLMPEEVENILMASRRGHIMGPFTFHSTPAKFLDALTDLYLQRFRADRDAIKQTLSDDVLASVFYNIEYGNEGKKRRIVGVFEHFQGKPKPIYLYDQTTGKYEAFPIENEELREKIANLAYVDPELYEEVRGLIEA